MCSCACLRNTVFACLIRLNIVLISFHQASDVIKSFGNFLAVFLKTTVINHQYLSGLKNRDMLPPVSRQVELNVKFWRKIYMELHFV